MILIDLYCANINPEKENFICALHKFYLEILFEKTMFHPNSKNPKHND